MLLHWLFKTPIASFALFSLFARKNYEQKALFDLMIVRKREAIAISAFSPSQIERIMIFLGCSFHGVMV
jgi:hypothetical protein